LLNKKINKQKEIVEKKNAKLEETQAELQENIKKA
jgi:hypothetical protein